MHTQRPPGLRLSPQYAMICNLVSAFYDGIPAGSKMRLGKDCGVTTEASAGHPAN
jgi:hypothetical protein